MAGEGAPQRPPAPAILSGWEPGRRRQARRHTFPPARLAFHTPFAQILNVYADQLSQGLLPEAAEVTFYVRRGEGEDLGQVRGPGQQGQQGQHAAAAGVWQFSDSLHRG